MISSTRFNSEMLTLARQARELTQDELAVQAGTTQGRISKIEHGLTVPTDELVGALAHVLDVPTSFFFQDGHNYPLPVRFHRKRQRLTQKTLDRIHAEVNIRAFQIRALLQEGEFEPDLPFERIDPEGYDAVEDIARVVRSLWHLPRGPIANVINLLERAGIICVPMRFGVPEFDAVTQIVPEMPPVVFFNDEAPMDRLRFTLAHELAHLVLHAVPSPKMEEEANRFAAEFLMPRADIEHHLARLSLPALATLKQIWRVSMAALLEHAKHLGTLTERQYIRLRSLLSSHGYLRREPPELDPPREHPRALRALIDFHLSELRYGLGELGELLNAFPHWIRETYFPGSKALHLVRKGVLRRA